MLVGLITVSQVTVFACPTAAARIAKHVVLSAHTSRELYVSSKMRSSGHDLTGVQDSYSRQSVSFTLTYIAIRVQRSSRNEREFNMADDMTSAAMLKVSKAASSAWRS